MASIQTLRTQTQTLRTHRAQRPSRLTVTPVSAQAQHHTATREAERSPREVATRASSSTYLLSPQSAPTPGWFQVLTDLFSQETNPRADADEWYREFGHLLDASEEQGGQGHSMYGSHLAERMAVEPRHGN